MGIISAATSAGMNTARKRWYRYVLSPMDKVLIYKLIKMKLFIFCNCQSVGLAIFFYILNFGISKLIS